MSRTLRIFLVILCSPLLALLYLGLGVGRLYRYLCQRLFGWTSRGRTRRALKQIHERAGFDPLGEPLHWAYTLRFRYAPELLKLGRDLEEQGYTLLSIDMPETVQGFHLRVGHHRHHTLPSLLTTLRELRDGADTLGASAESWEVAREEDAELWRVPGSYSLPAEATPHECTRGNAGRLAGLDCRKGNHNEYRDGENLESGTELADEVLAEMAAAHVDAAEPLWLHTYFRFESEEDAESAMKALQLRSETGLEVAREVVNETSHTVAVACQIRATRRELTELGDELISEATRNDGECAGWEINLKPEAEAAAIAFKKLMADSADSKTSDR
ncbi:MAG: ribonuclease E inhibitor RraB, partial [Candidatus Methylacidiphilales bacterium]